MKIYKDPNLSVPEVLTAKEIYALVLKQTEFVQLLNTQAQEKKVCPRCGYYYVYEIGYGLWECGECYETWK